MLNLCAFGKCLSDSNKNFLPILVATNPLLKKALLNNFLELLKTVLSDDNLFIRQETLSGKFFIILGGYLEFTLMYNGLLSGLLYGLYLLTKCRHENKFY